MKTIQKLIFVCFCLATIQSHAFKVDTVLTFSAAMHKNIKSVIITPDSYQNGNHFPVLYLLHGYSGNYSSWCNDMAVTKELVDKYQFIIVCPDGNYSSWYFDSPLDSTCKSETYVSKELVNWVDANFKTMKDKRGRAISGLSMGGHGALFLAFRHQDVFGACGSMSGGVDIRPFPLNWDIAKRLGEMKTFPENWEKYTVINQLYLLSGADLKIIFDCGTEDFFYDVNLRLHQELLYRNIPHDFISRPGGHTVSYWNNALKYQALFFADFFADASKSYFPTL